MKSFSTFIQESVLDIPRNSLDPEVFQSTEDRGPILNPAIKIQIIKDVAQFAEIIPLKGYYMVGSILTRTYSKNSDIDVNVELYPEDVDDLVQEKLISIVKSLNGRLAVGTTHPINYYITLGSTDSENNFDAIYDIDNERWLKEPKLFAFNVETYINKFMSAVSNIDLIAAKLRRTLIDYDELTQFSKDEVKDIKHILQSKLFEINQSIEALIDIRKTVKKERNKAFSRPMTPDEIEKYQTKNRLPQNVIYKMLQKYYYWNFIDKVKEILGEKDEIEPEDVDELKQAQTKLFGDSIEQEGEVINEIRKLKLRKTWDKPERVGSHLQVINRGMDRKNMRQVPQSRRIMTPNSIIGNSANRILTTAKKAPAGMWRLTPLQVRWISQKFHHRPMINVNKPVKHLGNTGIMLWRKDRGLYFLVKRGKHFTRKTL